MRMRTAEIKRKTRETDINLTLTISDSETGLRGKTSIGFFDHMLNTFCVHGGFLLELEMTGDIDVDCHHSIEDVGISLGSALGKIRDENKNIVRFASETIPMDESLASCSVDLCGRGYLVFNAEFKNPSVGGYDTQMTKEFFYALAQNMNAAIHINLMYGENDHHKTEAIYKSAARSIKKALEINDTGVVLSAKGNI